MPGTIHLPQLVRQAIANHIRRAVSKAIDGYSSAHEDEDVLTGHLGSALRITNRVVIAMGRSERRRKWTWSIDYAKFKGRGKHATEKLVGADGIFELRLQAGNRVERKTVLFQAKKEWNRDPNLLEQAILLSNWREAAVILNYTPTNFEVFRLDEIVAARGRRNQVTGSTSLVDFLTSDFLNCQVGDTDLQYDPANYKLVWRAMDGGLVASTFVVKSRILINVIEPHWGTGESVQEIDKHKIHDFRMRAESEDILGVPPTAPVAQKRAARNELAKTYHSDQLHLNDVFLRE